MIGNITYNFISSTFSLTNVLSVLAIIISVLGYSDSRKKLKIVLEKEKERTELKALLYELKECSEILKNIPNTFNLAVDFFISSVKDSVYEIENLNLNLRFLYIEIWHEKAHTKPKQTYYESEKISISSISFPEFKRMCEDKSIIGYHLIFEMTPKNEKYEVDCIEFADCIYGLRDLNKIQENLKDYESIIDSFDPQFFEILQSGYIELIQILYDTLKKEYLKFSFTRDMKPSQIENIIQNNLNQNLLEEKSADHSTEIRKRIDNLRKELNLKILGTV